MPGHLSPQGRQGAALIIAGPAFVIAALFLVNWLKRTELHARRECVRYGDKGMERVQPRPSHRRFRSLRSRPTRRSPARRQTAGREPAPRERARRYSKIRERPDVDRKSTRLNSSHLV